MVHGGGHDEEWHSLALGVYLSGQEVQLDQSLADDGEDAVVALELDVEESLGVVEAQPTALSGRHDHHCQLATVDDFEAGLAVALLLLLTQTVQSLGIPEGRHFVRCTLGGVLLCLLVEGGQEVIVETVELVQEGLSILVTGQSVECGNQVGLVVELERLH